MRLNLAQQSDQAPPVFLHNFLFLYHRYFLGKEHCQSEFIGSLRQSEFVDQVLAFFCLLKF